MGLPLILHHGKGEALTAVAYALPCDCRSAVFPVEYYFGWLFTWTLKSMAGVEAEAGFRVPHLPPHSEVLLPWECHLTLPHPTPFRFHV